MRGGVCSEVVGGEASGSLIPFDELDFAVALESARGLNLKGPGTG